MKRINYDRLGAWRDSIRDNFWMMMALIYSQPVAPVAQEPVDELEYLFSDSADVHHMDVDWDIDQSDFDDFTDRLEDAITDWHDDCNDESGCDDFDAPDLDFYG